MTVGYVYLLKSKLAPIYKIGKAAEHRVNQRLKELKVGKKNEEIGAWRVADYSEVEEELHREYSEYRIPQSEYFALPETAVSSIVNDLNNCQFEGAEIGSKGNLYGYIMIDAEDSDFITLQDSDGEVVGISYEILPEVILKLKDVHDLYSPEAA